MHWLDVGALGKGTTIARTLRLDPAHAKSPECRVFVTWVNKTMHIDLNSLRATQAYHLMLQSIVPRPIAWVLTENQTSDENAPYNLAPFSYFTAVASSPPTLMISIGVKPEGAQKDTLANIQRTQNLVVHIASTAHLDALNQSSATLPYGQSELDSVDLGVCAFEDFALPRLESAQIALACQLDHIHLIGDTPQSLVFARIETAYLSDDIATQDDRGRISIDHSSLDPLARLGGNDYAQLGKPLNRPRPR